MTEEDFPTLRLHDYLTLMAAAVLYYDHILTSGDEISYIWRRPWTLGKISFILNRYFAAISNALVIYESFANFPSRICTAFEWEYEIALLISQIFIGVLMVVRVYVIYNRSRCILATLIVAGILAISGAIGFTLQGRTMVDTDVPGCHVIYPGHSEFYLAAAWEACFAFDSLIFTLTVIRTWKMRPPQVEGLKHWWGIGMLFLRDGERNSWSASHLIVPLYVGALYYGCMVLANAANILTYYFGQPLLKGALSIFANTISVTMMSRLIVNLYRYVESRSYLGTQDIPLTNLSSSGRTISGPGSQDANMNPI